MRKTDRTYGAVWSEIKSVASQRTTFTADNISTLPRNQATRNLRRMATTGELVLIKRGIAPHVPAIYAKAA